jgi:hypothetical protein
MGGREQLLSLRTESVRGEAGGSVDGNGTDREGFSTRGAWGRVFRGNGREDGW